MKVHQTIGIVRKKRVLTYAEQEETKPHLQGLRMKLIGITTTTIGSDTVTMFICVFPADWDAHTCCEYTCIDGWFLTLDENFQVTGYLK